MNKIAIIAPHIDDELIGCFSVIKDSWYTGTPVDIYWLSSDGPSGIRTREAENALEGYSSSTRTVNGYFGVPSKFQSVRYSRIYVPAVTDNHVDHKKANAEFRKYATHFYSTNLEGGDVLQDFNTKKKLLDTFYPSQKSLWDSNASFYLFEKIRTWDIQVIRKYNFYLGEDLGTVRVPCELTPKDLGFISKNKTKASMDYLISLVGNATNIEIEIGNVIYRE